MGVNVGGSGKAGMAHPDLHIFHRNFIFDEQACAGVTQIMESDWTQTVFSQDVAEVSAYVIWINKIPHIIYTDVLQIFFTIASTALLALLFLTGFRCNQCGFNRRYQRQCTEAGIVLCPFFGDISTAFPSTLTHSNVCEMVMVLFTKSMADHFSPTTSLRRRP